MKIVQVKNHYAVKTKLSLDTNKTIQAWWQMYKKFIESWWSTQFYEVPHHFQACLPESDAHNWQEKSRNESQRIKLDKLHRHVYITQSVQTASCHLRKYAPENSAHRRQQKVGESRSSEFDEFYRPRSSSLESFIDINTCPENPSNFNLLIS